MTTNWFDKWFDTVKGEFGGYGDNLKQSLAKLGFTTELSLSQLELADLDLSDIPLGQKKALLFITATLKAKSAGLSVAKSNPFFPTLFSQHIFPSCRVYPSRPNSYHPTISRCCTHRW